MSLSKIVVGVDGSPIGQRAVAFAVDLAGSLGIELVAVHAFEPLSMIGKVPPPLDFAALEAAAKARGPTRRAPRACPSRAAWSRTIRCMPSPRSRPRSARR